MKPFDDILKQKLEDLQVPYDSAHWQQMEEQLDSDATAIPPVDALAVERLGELSSDLPEGSWDAFSAKLEASEQRVDELAREELSDLVTPFDPDHWPLMRRRLDEAFTLRGIIYRYKLAEIGLMLLLLWTVLLYVPVPDLLPLRDSEPIPDNGTPAPGDQVIPPAEFLPRTFGSTPPIAGASEIRQETSAEIAPEEAISVNETSATNHTSFPVHDRSAVVNALPRANSELPLNTTLDLSNQIATSGLLSPLPGWTSADLAGPVLPADAAVSTLPVRPGRMRISMVAGPDYNRIFTPADQTFGTPALFIDTIGFTAGLLVEYQRGPWSLETGANYVHKSYRPRLPQQQYGTFEFLVVETFEGISLELLQIPFNLRYSFLPRRPNWDFYALGGFSANLLLEPAYDIRRQHIGSYDAKEEPKGEELQAITSKSLLNDRQFPAGLFNGGNLGDNSYLTTTFGFGLERHLNRRWSLFLQPQLQVQLPFDGFGPNADQFHSFSLRFGTRAWVW